MYKFELGILLGIFLTFLISFEQAFAKQPNILLILADDLGYNDVSWHNPDIISPNLEALANNGTKLENAYVQPICSPTRSALMTGYYPYHLGRQSDVIRFQMPRGLFTNYTLMPQHLKHLGYSTHIVGKWHLGFCSENYFPMNRGFDTHYGYLTGSQDYFHHDSTPQLGDKKPGYDFRENFEIAKSVDGEYSANLFGKRVVDLIESHDQNNPFFIYLAFQSVHSPLQVPKKYTDMYPHISNQARKTFSGMVTAMDEAVGNITTALEQSGMLDNTFIVFSGDVSNH